MDKIYIEYGSLIFIIGSSVYYKHVFSKQLQKMMYFIDHPGFLPGEYQDLTILDIINAIENKRQQLVLSKIILIGHSIHAFMALEYAKYYPQILSTECFSSYSYCL